MAHNSLTAIECKNVNKPGKYGDGGGLMLLVQPGKPDLRRSWVLRLRTAGGARRDFGLGSFPDVSLAAARAKAAMMRDQVRNGIDPRSPDVDPRAKARAEATAAKVEAERAAVVAKVEVARRFDTIARRLHVELSPTFRAPKHAAQWLTRLETYAFPAIGGDDVDTITGPLVIDVLAPSWLAKPETARRVRQLIAAVLDYAHAKGLRATAAPTPGMLAKGLPAQPARDRHFEAVPYPNAPTIFAALRDAPDSTGRLALAFTILTVARSGETRGATWGEIDMGEAVWRIPAARMKMQRAHVVPLSPSALTVLAQMREARLRENDPAELIFPGARGRPISDMTMGKAQGLIAPGTTVHGWRSTFRDWVAEATDFTADLGEASLAHAIGDATRRAYERGDKLEKRRALMAAWADYVSPLPRGVTRLAPRSRLWAS